MKPSTVPANSVVISSEGLLIFDLLPSTYTSRSQQLTHLHLSSGTVSSPCPTFLEFCTAGVDEARVNHVLESISSLMQSSTVFAKKVEAVLGLLTFVSQVIWGSKLFLRSAYNSLRAAQTRKGVRNGSKWVRGFSTLSRNCILDLKWWHQVVTAQNTRKLVLGIFLHVSNFEFAIYH